MKTTCLKSAFLLLGVLLLGCQESKPNALIEQKLAQLQRKVRLLSALEKDIVELRKELELVKQHSYESVPKSPGEQRDISSNSSNDIVVQTILKPSGSDKDDPFIGPPEAPYVAMIFSDYQCKPCRTFYKTVFAHLLADYVDDQNIKIIARDFPLSSSKFGLDAAVFAHCAGEQGQYWQAFHKLYANPELVDDGNFDSLKSELTDLDLSKVDLCVKSNLYEKEVKADISEGLALGAKGAPGMFIGAKNTDGLYIGEFIRGAQPYAFIKQRIELLMGEESTK